MDFKFKNYSNINLVSDNLILRAFNKNDLFDLAEYLLDESITTKAGCGSFNNIEEVRDCLNSYILSKDTLAIVYNNKVIGDIDITNNNVLLNIIKVNKYINSFTYILGYKLNKEYHNQGIMTKALNMLLPYLFKNYNFDYLIVAHKKDNLASKAVLKKVGFDYQFKQYILNDELFFYELRNPNRSFKFEVCTGSYYDAYNASKAKAKRIELNNSLYLGGLTPSIGALKLIKEEFNLETICMSRPRGAGFLYNKEEINEMFITTKLLLENGADGIAFGFLTKDFRIDENLTREMITLIHSYNKIAVFHRAIDISSNYLKDAEILRDLGVDRILTSGCFQTAQEGINNLRDIYKLVGQNVEIVAASGVNISNIKEIHDNTGIYAFHTSCKTYEKDLTSKGVNGLVDYNFYKDNLYDTCDSKKVEDIINLLDKGL